MCDPEKVKAAVERQKANGKTITPKCRGSAGCKGACALLGNTNSYSNTFDLINAFESGHITTDVRDEQNDTVQGQTFNLVNSLRDNTLVADAARAGAIIASVQRL